MADEYADGEHAFAGPLLPWYVNETLDAGERERVRQHVDRCSTCREDLQLLERVRSAVRHSDATPMVPAPRPEHLLEAVDRRVARSRRLRRVGFAASVAALGALTFGAGIWVSGAGDAPPARFRTLTSEPQGPAMDYVFDLHFEAGLTAADHQRVLNALRATHVESRTPDGPYRITLRLPAWSLSELEAFTRRIESMPEVRSTRVVAMQLPVRQGQGE